MTQFKDKSTKIKSPNGMDTIPTGLLMYPTLMVGDILLYNANLIPVGIDQKQHVELTRNIVQRLNNKYKTSFNEPNPYIPNVGAKIMSLVDPTKKMSKSDKNDKASIYLLDDPEVAYKKIMKAVTDSENKIYISNEKPGILNLLTIYSALNDLNLEESENKFKNKNYGELKISVAESVKSLLINIQSKYKDMLLRINELSKIGAEKATKIAKENLEKLMKRMGLK